MSKITIIEHEPYRQLAFPSKKGQNVYTHAAVIKALMAWDNMNTFQYELQSLTDEYSYKVEKLIAGYTK